MLVLSVPFLWMLLLVFICLLPLNAAACVECRLSLVIGFLSIVSCLFI